MYCIIYRFEIKSGSEKEFKDAWQSLTLLFRRYAGSLGSRLHRAGDDFIAYAQWPDKETYDRADVKLPKEEAERFRKQMAESCIKIERIPDLEVEIDLLP